MARLSLVGFDPSKRHWGIAKGLLDTETQNLFLTHLGVIEPKDPKFKLKKDRLPQSHIDALVAQQLFSGALAAAGGADFVVAEYPIGSQSAEAMKGYGICMGVLGALQMSGVIITPVSPYEVKRVVGEAETSKEEMIAWAMAQHPEAPWPMQTKKGVTSVVASKAEHMADAIAALYAACQRPEVQARLLTPELT